MAGDIEIELQLAGDYSKDTQSAGGRTSCVPAACHSEGRCGGADAVLKVEEPEVCVYAMDMESPAACTDDDLRRARDDLALFGA